MPEPLGLAFRRMAESDLSVASYIGREAMDGLRRSQAQQPPPWVPAAPLALRHLLGTDSDGAWVAELNGIAVGYSMSIVRGDIWFLSQLFVQPDQHGHGIGAELLRRAQDYGRSRDARFYSVIASTSPVAHALYMRAGMFATGIGYRMSGPLEPLLRLPEPEAGKKQIAGCSGWEEGIAPIDREVFGAERRQDHEFYLSGKSRPGEEASFGLSASGTLLGYGYAAADGGHIGPLAALEASDQLMLLRHAALWLLEHEVTTGIMFVLSLNPTIMSALLAAGWRSLDWTFLLTSAAFGSFDRYQPSGGTML